MKFKHKYDHIDDAINELSWFEYKSNYGYLILTHDNKILFFTITSGDWDTFHVTYDDVTNDFEIIKD